MAKRIEGWQCDKCGSIYDADVQAAQCEADHTKLSDITITWASFRPIKETYGPIERPQAQRVPIRLSVRFSKVFGDFATYRLEQYGPRSV